MEKEMDVIQTLESWRDWRNELLKDEELYKLDQDLRSEMRKRGQDCIFMTTTGQVFLTLESYLLKHSVDDLSPMSIATLKDAKKARTCDILGDFVLLLDSKQL